MVDIYWYFTDLPFLPFPTVFNSLDWSEDPWHHTGLGEVFGAPRTYNGMENVPGLLGGHFCGTRQDFEQGPAWPPTGEPLVYGPDGIPTCCRRDQVGLVTGGGSPAAIVVGPPYSGRVTGSGRPDAIVQQIHRPRITLSGSSSPGAIVEYSLPIWGDVTGGSYPSALVESTMPHVTEMTCGAYPSAIVELVSAPPARVTGGCSPAALIGTTPALLGRVTAGCYPLAVIQPFTCPPARLQVLDVDNPYNLGDFAPDFYYLENLIAGERYSIRSIDPDPDTAIQGGWRLWWGGACDFRHEFFFEVTHPRCFQFIMPVTGYLWVSITVDHSIPAFRTWVFKHGACPP